MKWKANRFFSKNRGKASSSDLPEISISTKAYQSLFRQQLKALRYALGEQKLDRFYKKALHKKTVYCVLESPHANLTALSGHSVADVTPRVKGQAISRTTLPSWHSDGSSLLMNMHFENEVYTSNYSFEDTLSPLMDTLGGVGRGKCLGGIVIYLHRHDLILDSTPAWLSKMASFIGQASAISKQKLPVYILLEGVGVSETVALNNRSSNGVTMPMGMLRDDETVSAEQFGQWFAQAQTELTKRLMRKTLKDVQYVHDVASRKAAFSQLNAVEQGLQQLKKISEQFNHRWNFSGKSTVPWIRAVFIAPTNAAVINGVPSANGLDSGNERHSNNGSYHWWQRFSNILLKDRGCGNPDPKNNSHRKLVALCTGGAVLLGLAWSQLMWRDYAHAGQLVDQFNEYLMPLSSDNSNAMDISLGFDRILETLTSIDAFNDDLGKSAQSTLWLSSFSPSTIDKQQQTLNVFSESILTKEFSAALDQTLLETLHRSNDFEELYPALKSYLYFHQERDQRSEYIMWWFGQRWQQTYQQQPEKRQKLAQYLSLLLENQSIIEAVDAEAVSIARAKMLSTPLAKRLYFDIKQSASNRYSTSSELKEIIGYRQMDVFETESISVPSFYTKVGYQTLFLPKMRQVVEQASADEWVLEESKQEGQANTKADLVSLEKAIYDLYVADYSAAWDDFLDQLAIANTTSFDHLISLVKSTSGRDGAIYRVLSYVHDNTDYYSIPTAVNAAGMVEGAAAIAPPGLALSANKATRGLKGVDRYLEKGIDSIHPMSAVTKHFKRLNSVINNSEGQSSAMQEVDKQLVMLEDYLSELDSSSHDSGNMTSVFDATVKRVKGSRKDAISQLNRTSRLMPEPLNRWVSSLSGQAWGHMVSRTKRLVGDAYQDEIVEFYREHLNKKYPLDSRSEEDLLIDRFSEFFKPEGREQSFFNQYIKPFVRTNNKRWTEKAVDGLSLGFKRDYLTQLQRADDIRKAMFNKRHEAFAELQLQPVYLDANISRFDLNLMGERLSYRHGPQKISKISWPPMLNEDDIAMRFEDYNGNLVTEEMSGDWSLFRLIERYGKETSPNGLRYRMSFEVDGQRAVYNASGRTLSPALLGMLSKYRVPLKPLS